MEKKFVYSVRYPNIVRYELVKETPQTFLVATEYAGNMRVSKFEYFPTELEAWEHFDKIQRRSLQSYKDKMSVCQQHIQTAQKEIARLKRNNGKHTKTFK